MNIMYLCDNNYAYIAGISMLSLMDNNKNTDEIMFFLVEDGVDDDNKRKLKEIVNKYNRQIIFIPKPNLKPFLGEKIQLHWWIENVYSRVFLQEVFKDYPDVVRLIYIDCDTLILGNIEDLWNIELGNYIGAGVCEAMGSLHKKGIGLTKIDNYFNAGMFLIDLDKWRTNEIDKEASTFVKSHNGKLEYADESVLNGVLSTKIMRVSPKYNITSLTVYFNEKELKRYRKSYYTHSEAERKEALSDPRIVHFTSTFLDNRPWVEECKHPFKDKWDYYKMESPWKNQEPSKDNRSKKKKAVRIIVMKLPKSLRIEITGFIHAYIKPLPYIF